MVIIVGQVITSGVIECKMKCKVEEENERLKEENRILKEEMNDLQDKVRELIQNSGKDKKKNGSRQ